MTSNFEDEQIKDMKVRGNSIVYRNHKDCDGYASLYDGSPSHMVL